MNLFDVAEQLVVGKGEKELLKFGEKTWTNARLLSEAERLASLLLSRGLRPGHHVMILLPNGPEVFLSFLALARLGCVGVPVGVQLTERELSIMARDAECRWLITAGDLTRKAWKSRSDSEQGILDVNEILAGAGKGSPLPEACSQESDLAYIVYTSGTQGEPKGVMLTHQNIIAEGRGVAEAFTVPGENPEDLTQLLVLPLSHSYGLMVMTMTYFMGNMTVVLPRYRTEVVLEAIRDNEVRLMWAVPTMYALMLSHPEAEEYLRTVVHWDSGGAHLPLSNLQAIENRFGGTVTDGYGCTEASGCVTTQSRKQYSPPGTQGFLIKGDYIEVVDDQGDIVPDGQPGEFVISGDTLMRGYWKKREYTEQAFKEGAYRSGDIGVKHPDGYYTFMERKDDLIIRGGENIYPREIENILYQHPDILEAAVKGVPDPIMGQEVKAYVSLREGAKADEKTLQTFLADQIASYKVPRFIEIWRELPKNSRGKILGRALPN